MFNFIKRLFGIGKIPVATKNQVQDLLDRAWIPSETDTRMDGSYAEYFHVSGTETEKEYTPIKKETIMSADATIISLATTGITEAVKLIDDLVDLSTGKSRNLKGLPATYATTVTKIVKRVPKLDTGVNAVAELDWYETTFQTLVNACAAGKIKNVPGFDAFGRIGQANQSVEGAFKKIAAAGINVADYGYTKNPNRF